MNNKFVNFLRTTIILQLGLGHNDDDTGMWSTGLTGTKVMMVVYYSTTHGNDRKWIVDDKSGIKFARRCT